MRDSEVMFNELMQVGNLAHESGDHALALFRRLSAFEIEPPDFGDRGIAARDVAVSFDLLGDQSLSSGDDRVRNQVLADAYSEYAYREHKAFRDIGDEHLSREFTRSALYCAVIAARQDRKKDALKYIEEGLKTSREKKAIYRMPHQYDVDLIGTYVGMASLYRSDTSGAVRGFAEEAKSLAKITQSNEVLEPDLSLTRQQKRRIKSEARVRAWASSAVLRLQTGSNTTRPLANRIFQRFVL